MSENKIYYHLPGLFEFYELYSLFLPLFYNHKEYFYDNVEIGSIYGAPIGCIWAGGRTSEANYNPKEVIELMNKYNISSRLTFSNSLLEEKHLSDKRCNDLCLLFEKESIKKSGVIVHSNLLKDYLKEKYPNLYLVSSTTKVLTDFNDLKKELDDCSFEYVVPDFRLNKQFDKLNSLSQIQKNKVEFLVNECCSFSCKDRKACYQNVSRLNLQEDCDEFKCTSLNGSEGYKFSLAMKNPGFIGLKDINETYLTNGFNNFKIEGRGLGSALVLEFLLYYLTKPEYILIVREEIYLDNQLDLF